MVFSNTVYHRLSAFPGSGTDLSACRKTCVLLRPVIPPLLYFFLNSKCSVFIEHFSGRYWHRESGKERELGGRWEEVAGILLLSRSRTEARRWVYYSYSLFNSDTQNRNPQTTQKASHWNASTLFDALYRYPSPNCQAGSSLGAMTPCRFVTEVWKIISTESGEEKWLEGATDLVKQ